MKYGVLKKWNFLALKKNLRWSAVDCLPPMSSQEGGKYDKDKLIFFATQPQKYTSFYALGREDAIFVYETVTHRPPNVRWQNHLNFN